MSLIILPLGQCPLALRGIFLLVEELLEDFHGLLIRNDSLAVKLVFTITEPDDVVNAPLAAHDSGAGSTDRLIVLVRHVLQDLALS